MASEKPKQPAHDIFNIWLKFKQSKFRHSG